MSENNESSGNTEPGALSFEARLERIQRELEAIDYRARRLMVQRPLAAVALAVGVGYLLGRALTKAR